MFTDENSVLEETRACYRCGTLYKTDEDVSLVCGEYAVNKCGECGEYGVVSFQMALDMLNDYFLKEAEPSLDEFLDREFD